MTSRNSGRFIVKKGSTGKFRFSLVAVNGDIVLTSEAYDTKAAALRGIRSVKALAQDSQVEEVGAGTGATAKKPAKAKKLAKASARVSRG